MPAVNPQSRTSLPGPMRKAGVIQPLGPWTLSRWAGSRSSAIGAAMTACTSSGSTTATGVGSCHQPSTGVTAKLLGGSQSSGSSAKTSTPLGSRPVSSCASRSAASTGVSPASMDPPGKDTWPGCERMWWARSVSRT